jgi:hypothetical protein
VALEFVLSSEEMDSINQQLDQLELVLDES